MSRGGIQTFHKASGAAPASPAFAHFFSVIAKFQPNSPKRPKNLIGKIGSIPLMSFGNPISTRIRTGVGIGIFIDEKDAE